MRGSWLCLGLLVVLCAQLATARDCGDEELVVAFGDGGCGGTGDTTRPAVFHLPEDCSNSKTLLTAAKASYFDSGKEPTGDLETGVMYSAASCKCQRSDYKEDLKTLCVDGKQTRELTLKDGNKCTANDAVPVKKEDMRCRCDPKKDATTIYQPCDANDQRLVHFNWKEDSNCRVIPELPLPTPNPTTLKCSVFCGAGTRLTSAGVCETCEAQTFSLGGGENFSTWKPMPSQFTTTCYAKVNGEWKQEDNYCKPWTPTADGSSIYSGNNTGIDNLYSKLELQVNFEVEGWVQFYFRVDAEDGYDGLEFLVDETKHLDRQSQTDWNVHNFTVPAGRHTLKWYYIKDFTLAAGEDLAEIKYIQIGGLRNADATCSRCPDGSFSKAGSGSCSPCEAGQHFVVDKCVACGDDEYSLKGSPSCIKRPLCVPGDIAEEYSECVDNGGKRSRNLSYKFKGDPPICLTANYTLPDAVTGVDCAPCNPGQVLKDGKCTPCEAGTAASKGGSTCDVCAAGSFAPPQQYFDYFDTTTFSKLFRTSCRGDCAATSGWRVSDNHIETDPYHGTQVDVHLALDTEVGDSASVTFEYSLFTDVHGDNGLSMYINGTGVAGVDQHCQEKTCTKKVPLKPGYQSLEWVFRKRSRSYPHFNDTLTIWSIVVEGVKGNVGSGDCRKCEPGSFSGEKSQSCTLCKPGQFAKDEGSTSCDTCDDNSFTGEAGSSECIPCSTGRTSESEHTKCEDTCRFETNGMTFDWKANHEKKTVGPVKIDSDHYSGDVFFSFCNTVNDQCKRPDSSNIDTHACLVETIVSPEQCNMVETKASSLGMVPAYDPLGDVEGFRVTYTGGKCVNDNQVLFQISTRFVCDPAGTALPTYIKSESTKCHPVYEYKTIDGCRYCGESDFSEIMGECVEDSQTIHYALKDGLHCRPGTSQPPDKTVECESPTKLPVGGIVAFVLITLLLSGGLAFLAARFFKLRAKHNKLKAQFGDRLLDMDDFNVGGGDNHNENAPLVD
eukprot:GFYU01001235.1.p1 GENE.GFYU01001235.1~~GFYU01001235.1.p1  ORF type:complete len:1003 (+),score=308.90 GFYU01001235.1:133-3141(+)